MLITLKYFITMFTKIFHFLKISGEELKKKNDFL